jgi:hypothetical protein
MVVFDNTFLCLLFHPGVKPPNDSKGVPVTRCRDRIDQLVSELEARHDKILIPTPALSELLVVAGPNYVQYLNEINGRSCFKVIDFDQRAAIEAALRISAAIAAGDIKSGTQAQRQIVKFDRQIVAIARVEGVKTIYSDDKDVKKYSDECGITTVRVEELPLPPPTQMLLTGMSHVKTETASAEPKNPAAVQSSSGGDSKGETGTEANPEIRTAQKEKEGLSPSTDASPPPKA